ncbi:MAG: aldo/keto reductase, partial [Lutimaribacter sp.]
HAARALHVGDANVMIAGGVEHMTRGPWVLSKTSSAFGRDMELHDTSFGWRFINPRLDALYGTDGMGQTAENVVDLHGISRDDQDAFAAWSQAKAAQAQTEGRLATDHRYAARYGLPQMHKAAQDLAALAADLGVHPATLAVAWVLQHPAAPLPILSARNAAQLAPSLAAINYALDAETYAKLQALFPAPPPATDRIEEV